MREHWSEITRRWQKQRPYMLAGNSETGGPATDCACLMYAQVLLLMPQVHHLSRSIAPPIHPHLHQQHFLLLIHISRRFYKKIIANDQPDNRFIYQLKVQISFQVTCYKYTPEQGAVAMITNKGMLHYVWSKTTIKHSENDDNDDWFRFLFSHFIHTKTEEKFINVV